MRSFLGVDGEGWGQNRHGQQHYMLLSAAGAGFNGEPLYTGKRLTTTDCLDWICDLPADPLLVGFSFGYDATQILRDLPTDRLDRLFGDKEAGDGKSRYTWFRDRELDFGVEYLPKNYLRVCRMKRGHIVIDGHRTPTLKRIDGSARTIYETFGFFQKSFLSALRDFNVGPEHWAMIDRNKAARQTFAAMSREILDYNTTECLLLAELMERFRELCHDAGLRPRTWNGAGKLSAFLHDKHGTITSKELADVLPSGVDQMARDAYYGGRFEVTHVGEIPGPIYEYDINSAYPAAMRELPCLEHGRWHPFTGGKRGRGLYVAYVSFTHPRSAAICGLPIRQHDGRLFWPREGQGVYWSPEIRSARKLGAQIKHTMGWRYERRCKCHPFDWVEPLFEKRRALQKDTRGYPIKLGLASLYGKLAQRIGNPRWGNFVWAGLITAITRATLNRAAAQAPEQIVMTATDALLSRVPLTLPVGEGLGEWELKPTYPRLFIVQPGVYFGASRPKTRGVPASLFADHVGKFERLWAAWCATPASDLTGPPIVAIPVPLFTGLRLAHARGKPETAGVWLKPRETWDGQGDAPPGWREYSFDWTRKRAAAPIWDGPLTVRTMPAPGAPDLVSVPHPENKAWSLLDQTRMELDEQPDHLDLSPIV